MKVDPELNAPRPVFDGDELLALRPDIAGLARLEVRNLFNMPSEYMGPEQWVLLQRAVNAELAREEVAGVIVSHGTDTMEESAWFLDLTLDSPKPVVLVGAQRNASEADFDGPRNLFNAVRICLSNEAREKGVVICLNDQINAAREASKTSTSEVATFKSGDFGFLGQVDPVVVIASRVPNGRVFPLYGYEGGGRSLADAGAVYADNLSPQHSRVLLMLGIHRGMDAKAIARLFAH